MSQCCCCPFINLHKKSLGSSILHAPQLFLTTNSSPLIFIIRSTIRVPSKPSHLSKNDFSKRRKCYIKRLWSRDQWFITKVISYHTEKLTFSIFLSGKFLIPKTQLSLLSPVRKIPPPAQILNFFLVFDFPKELYLLLNLPIPVITEWKTHFSRGCNFLSVPY